MPEPISDQTDGRLYYRGDPILVNAFKQAAVQMGLSVSAYLTLALRNQMRADGYTLPPAVEPARRGPKSRRKGG